MFGDLKLLSVLRPVLVEICPGIGKALSVRGLRSVIRNQGIVEIVVATGLATLDWNLLLLRNVLYLGHRRIVLIL